MSLLQKINIGRLLLAIAVTVLIADTAAHPTLSAGLLESGWGSLAASLIGEHGVTAAHADLAQ